MRDLYSRLSPAVTLAAQTADADVTGTEVDLQGFESAMISLEIGVGGISFSGSNKIEFVLEHSDDKISWTAVTAEDVQGVTGITSGIVKALTTAHATADVTRIGYVGGKRYIRLNADFSGTHGTGTPFAATVIRGNPALAPV